MSTKGESSKEALRQAQLDKGKGKAKHEDDDDVEMVEDPVRVGALHRDLKISVPEPFHGERSKLSGFLIQVNLYLSFHKTKFSSDTEKVLWIVTLLRGPALGWIEGYVADYMMKTNERGEMMRHMLPNTISYMHTLSGFVEGLTITFGEIDGAKKAAIALQTLRQKGSAATYTAEFQRHSTKLSWNDGALMHQYYRGLKEHVKDDLSREEPPKTLAKMIERTIQIDNRSYERTLEKKGLYVHEGKTWGSRKRDTYGGQPMELDATSKTLSVDEMQKHRDRKACFNCGKEGHFARNCRSGGRPQKGRGGRRNTGRRNELAVIGRGGYNGIMQINATLQEPWEWDIINTNISTLSILDTEGGWMDLTEQGNNGPEAIVYSAGREDTPIPAKTQRESWKERVLQDGELRKVVEEVGEEFKNNCREALGQYNSGHKTREALREQLTTRRDLMRKHVNNLTDIRRWGERRSQSIRKERSQQYKDETKINLTARKGASQSLHYFAELTKKLTRDIHELTAEYDMTRIDHPDHEQLGWQACYIDHCSTHRGAKMSTQTWPRIWIPVIVNRGWTSEGYPIPEPGWSKN
jgi:hypothetical protein